MLQHTSVDDEVTSSPSSSKIYYEGYLRLKLPKTYLKSDSLKIMINEIGKALDEFKNKYDDLKHKIEKLDVKMKSLHLDVTDR